MTTMADAAPIATAPPFGPDDYDKLTISAKNRMQSKRLFQLPHRVGVSEVRLLPFISVPLVHDTRRYRRERRVGKGAQSSRTDCTNFQFCFDRASNEIN
jgi:hypothetical protein